MNDIKQPYRKEKVIAGIPKYFGQKVREYLSDEWYTSYPTLTYGETINAINRIGLTLYVMTWDLKIKWKEKENILRNSSIVNEF